MNVMVRIDAAQYIGHSLDFARHHMDDLLMGPRRRFLVLRFCCDNGITLFPCLGQAPRVSRYPCSHGITQSKLYVAQPNK